MADETTSAKPSEIPATASFRTARWRRQLLVKLPKLGYERRDPKETFLLDEQWTNQERLRADAFLHCFESLANERDR